MDWLTCKPIGGGLKCVRSDDRIIVGREKVEFETFIINMIIMFIIIEIIIKAYFRVFLKHKTVAAEKVDTGR